MIPVTAQELQVLRNRRIHVPDKRQEVTYDVALNLWELGEMAEKAAKNRTGKSTCGPLRVRVVSRRQVRDGDE